jgi:hypothetical protein
MTDFFFLVPIAISLGLAGLASFMWTLKNDHTMIWKARQNEFYLKAMISRACEARIQIVPWYTC